MKISNLKKRLFAIWRRCSHRLGGFLALPVPRKGERPRDALYLLSLPRAGSTWVGRLLARHPALHYHFEPLNPDYSPLSRSYLCFRWDENAEPKVTRYFRQVADGNLLSWMSFLYQPPFRYFTAQGLLVKEVYTLFALSLLMKHQPNILLLVRHPCAIAWSHFSRGDTPDLHPVQREMEKSGLAPALAESLHLGLASPQGTDPLFVLGLYWEAAYRLAVDHQLHEQGTVLVYEQLVADPEQEWTRLLDALQLEPCPTLLRQLKASMSSSNQGYTRRDAQAAAQAWEKNLSNAQVDLVMQGVRFLGGAAFDTFYSKR